MRQGMNWVVGCAYENDCDDGADYGSSFNYIFVCLCMCITTTIFMLIMAAGILFSSQLSCCSAVLFYLKCFS